MQYQIADIQEKLHLFRRGMEENLRNLIKFVEKKEYGFQLIPSHKYGPSTSLRVARPERNAVESKDSGQTALRRSCWA
jgi:hypothetical protein